MIRSILISSQPVKERVKNLVYYLSLKRASKRVWDKKHRILVKSNPDFNRPLDPALRRNHRKTWEPFDRNFNDATLQICRAVSGRADPLIIPEEIFRTDIEPSLNRHSEAHFQAHKSFYNRWFEKGIFPEDLLHIVNGVVLDSSYKRISAEQATKKCRSFTYPVVMKPNMKSYGGKGVRFIESASELCELIRMKKNIVIQKKIRQHPRLARYHDQSLNTVRVYLYKSVRDDQIHILAMMPRFGNGAQLDNISTGGMASYLTEDGHLPGYALSSSLEKHTRHPISGTPFTGAIPDFSKLKELSLKVAGKLFLLRIIGLDLCYDVDGRWRVIEINTTGHTIRSIQYHGKPFFGKFTGEVIEYCKKYHWTKG